MGTAVAALGVWGWPGATLALLVVVALALGAAVASWRERDLPGGGPLGVVMFLVAVWCASYAGELTVAESALRMRFARLTLVVTAYVPVAWFVFGVEYTGRGPQVTVRLGALLVALPTATAALAVVGHPALIAPASTGTATVHGPWFLVHATYSYLLLAGGTALFALMHVVSDVRSVETRVVLVAVAVPWLTNLLHLSGLSPVSLDPTPFSFVLTGTLLIVGLSEGRHLGALPVAREVARDAVIETMDDGLLVLSEDGRVLDANPAAESMLDGCRIGDPFDSHTGLGGQLDDLPMEVDVEADGERRRYELRESTFEHAHGLVTGRLITIHDVTRTHRHSQRLAVLNRILRHDLRNDLNVIRGHAEMLDDDPAVGTRSPTVIREKSARLVELATKVRDAERTLGRTDSTVTDVDVAALVRDRVDDTRRERPFADVTLDLPSTPVVVRSSDLLGVAIDNLLENAVVHADSLTPNVSVAVRRTADGSTVEVVVADDGPGIPIDERQVLVDGHETPLEHGSGIGLWLVNWIVSESMGTVSFGENEPRGSVVTISLPTPDATASAD